MGDTMKCPVCGQKVGILSDGRIAEHTEKNSRTKMCGGTYRQVR